MSGARKAGLEMGREEGRKEGEKEKTIEIAKEMLAKGIEIELIKEITKLTEEELENIKKSKKV